MMKPVEPTILTQNQEDGKASGVARLFAYGSLLLTGLVVATVLFWSFQSSKVLEVKNSPVDAFPPEVQAGTSAIFLDIDYCKYTKVDGVVEVNLIGQTTGSKIGVTWPQDKTPRGCARLKQVPVLIPPQTPTDTYTAVFSITYAKINPIKPAQPVTFSSKPFKVVNKKLQPGDATVVPVK